MRRSGFAIAQLILCLGAFGQSASGQPTQWKQRIERPSRDWDYDGSRILGHIGYDICLWEATSGKLLHRMKGHKERIHVVQLSPDGRYALSSSWVAPGPIMYQSKDTRTILWDLATGRPRTVFKGQVAGEFSPNGKRILTFSQRAGKFSSFDATVWNSMTGDQVVKAKLDEHSGPYWDALHFSPDGRSFAYIANGAFLPYNSSRAVLFRTADAREIGRVAVRHGPHRYTSRGAMASFDFKQKIRLIDIKSGRALKTLEHELKSFWGGAWTHDGSKVVVIPYKETLIEIWDIKSGKMTIGARNGPYPQKAAIISPDNNLLVIEWGGANGIDPGMGIYAISTGKAIARIKLAKWGHMIGFSPDSKTLLVGGPEFVIYRSKDGKKVRSLKLIDKADFSHDWNR